MRSHNYSSSRCRQVVDILHDSHTILLSKIITEDDFGQLIFSCYRDEDTETGERFSEPMVWIGIYIATASFLCILAMAADLLHGLWNKKLWFPCKYFSLNAASVTVITIAMKLPVDLSSGMESYVDQATKIGSLGFMCTMMANIMPSLASMDNNTLLANVIGLCILVITVIVNICIQINTSVITNKPYGPPYDDDIVFDFVMVAYSYMTMILLLLIMMVSSSLKVPSFKEILEYKYQAINKISLTTDQSHMFTVEKLRQHVRRYWVMAETGSPQFGMASNPLSTASGVVCVVVFVLNFLMVFKFLFGFYGLERLLYVAMNLYASPYKWSTLAILLTQSIGVVVGTTAPISRCFSVFSFKLCTKWNRNDFIFFKVEKYWTQKLQEWKQSPVLFLSSCQRSTSLIYNSKYIILSLGIGFQKVIVILCKAIRLIVIVALIFLAICYYHCKAIRRYTQPSASRTNDAADEDLSRYVVLIENEIDLAEKTLKGISKSMNACISKVEKEKNNHLLELLEKSTGFEGVEIFDTDHIQPLLPVEPVNSWSLPIVTLTCVAVALLSDGVESLLTSVGEGLAFTHLVEESLNTANEYVNIRKTTLILWHEVENKCKWLDTPLAKSVFKEKTAIEVVRWFSDKGKEIVTEISTKGDLVDNPPKTLVVANSMYRITQTILLRYQSNMEPIAKEQLFAHLKGMIADIFCACFTNIPQVITTRCHESVIEKREASVKVAAKLLGKTTKIIERLETRVPTIPDDRMAYIDEWRRHYIKC
ncbi:hypothetical protein HanPSC8_Chr17g0756911 [Helianthus annuus]|nr:hypothetical protein HanPSC8_Chr17g0756911 [Helianthus annuus]